MPRPLRQIALLALFALSLGVAAPASGASAEESYQAARSDLLELLEDEGRMRFRDQWMPIIERLDRSVEGLPNTHRRCEALFNSGRAWHRLSQISYLHADRRQGIDRFEALVERCPASSLADDALLMAAELWVRMDAEKARATLERLLGSYPGGDMVPKARELLAELPQRRTQPAAAAAKATSPKPAKVKPPQGDSSSAAAARSATPVEAARAAAPRGSSGSDAGGRTVVAAAASASGAATGPLAPAGAASEAARDRGGDGSGLPSAAEILAALDAKGADAYRPEDLALAEDLAKDRAIADGTDRGAAEVSGADLERVEALREAVGGEIPISLAAGLKVKRVVIDPGHGGKDTGAIGKGGLYEKDLTLTISKKLRNRLAALGLEVFLTRETDVYLSLEERTRFANEKRADLFISVHVNAAENRKAHGIETYTLNLNSDRYAMRLAARENATSERSIGDLDLILADLTTKANTDDSLRLARHTQDRMVERLRARYQRAEIRDLGVKQALFFVLVGAKMPAILVEAGFITHAEESRRLQAKDYQEEIASSIADGVRRFMEEREAIARGEIPSEATVF